MEVLNNISLYEALVRCNDNKNYKVVIAFARLSDATNFANELLELHKATPIHGVEREFVAGAAGSRINFVNGSRVELITLTPRARSIMCNEVIYDNDVDIDDDRVLNMLHSMLVPYRCEEAESLDNNSSIGYAVSDRLLRYKKIADEAERSEELDEFLGSFSVAE